MFKKVPSWVKISAAVSTALVVLSVTVVLLNQPADQSPQPANIAAPGAANAVADVICIDRSISAQSLVLQKGDRPGAVLSDYGYFSMEYVTDKRCKVSWQAFTPANGNKQAIYSEVTVVTQKLSKGATAWVEEPCHIVEGDLCVFSYNIAALPPGNLPLAEATTCLHLAEGSWRAPFLRCP